jgi:hypothetical protein
MGQQVETSPILFMSMAVVLGVLGIVLVVGAFKQLRQMITKPNERLIQINLDYRLVPLTISVVLAAIFISGSRYGLEQRAEWQFIQREEASSGGFMGSQFVQDNLAARADGKCDHVQRTDGKPVFIAIDSSKNPSVLCGVTHEALSEQQMYPYIVQGEQHRLLLGKWPFSYEVAYTSKQTAR